MGLIFKTYSAKTWISGQQSSWKRKPSPQPSPKERDGEAKENVKFWKESLRFWGKFAKIEKKPLVLVTQMTSLLLPNYPNRKLSSSRMANAILSIKMIRCIILITPFWLWFCKRGTDATVPFFTSMGNETCNASFQKLANQKPAILNVTKRCGAINPLR